MRLLSDFRWTCANYVYTSFDLFSTSAYEAFKRFAPDRNIRLAASIGLARSPENEEYIEAVDKIMRSDCLVTIMVTQTVATGEMVREAHDQGYEGEIVIQGASMSIQGYLRSKLGVAQAHRTMTGIIAVSPFNGFGTPKFVC